MAGSGQHRDWSASPSVTPRAALDLELSGIGNEVDGQQDMAQSYYIQKARGSHYVLVPSGPPPRLTEFPVESPALAHDRLYPGQYHKVKGVTDIDFLTTDHSLDDVCEGKQPVRLTDTQYNNLVGGLNAVEYWRCTCGHGLLKARGCSATSILQHEKASQHKAFHEGVLHPPLHILSPSPCLHKITSQALFESRPQKLLLSFCTCIYPPWHGVRQCS